MTLKRKKSKFEKDQTIKKRHDISAQQIVETLLLFAAVIVVLVIFLNPKGPFRSAVRRVIDLVTDQIHP